MPIAIMQAACTKKNANRMAAIEFSRDWLKMKNPNAPAVKREAEEDWGNQRWR
jgi:hypothetical protein